MVRHRLDQPDDEAGKLIPKTMETVKAVSTALPIASETLAQLETFLAESRRSTAEHSALLGALHGHPSVFSMVADYVPQMIWLARKVGCLDYCNKQWMDYTGLSLEQSTGTSGWDSTVHPEDRAACLARWHAAAFSKTQYHAEYRLRRHDGTYRWHIGKATLLYDAKEDVTWWIGSCTDNHEQREIHERDRIAAQTLQQALLPEVLPTLDGVVLDGYYSPASEDFLVGGDWYNAFVLPDGRVAIVIGDVEGHGMKAAIAMAEVRLSFVITALQKPYSPNAVLHRANRVLSLRRHSNVTVVFGIFDPRKRTFSYAVAGHPAPVLVSPDGVAKFLENGGVPLGVLDSLELTLHEIRVEPGSMLVFYTDGLIDFDRQIIANEERLLAAAKVVLGSKVAWPAFLIREMLIGEHVLPDDVAIMTMQFA